MKHVNERDYLPVPTPIERLVTVPGASLPSTGRGWQPENTTACRPGRLAAEPDGLPEEALPGYKDRQGSVAS